STILAVVVAVLMAVPLTLYASHQFQDVPNSHTFHTAIDFMAANGITQGCNPPANTNYCPDDPVTRGQMAGFLKRFHDTFIVGGGIGLGFKFRDGTAPPDGGNGVVEGLNMNLTIPTAGVLHVTGSIRMANEVEGDVLSCGINFGTPPNTAESDSIRSMDLTFSFFETCSTTTAVNVAPGTQLVRITTGGALPTTQALQGNLTAVLYTVDEAFALASPADAVEFPEISDEPKDVG
ncbi:MAG: S-layer homology domain-containing protein, partial [Acidimicrobiia bacterium]